MKRNLGHPVLGQKKKGKRPDVPGRLPCHASLAAKLVVVAESDR
jgi:hypothetical protein